MCLKCTAKSGRGGASRHTRSHTQENTPFSFSPDCSCKVADFGLSRSLNQSDQTDDDGDGGGGLSADYYRSTSGIFPVRWTAPEGLSSQKFSSKSDVWSFAITCVEIFQDGERPFPIVKSNPEIIQFVMAGGGYLDLPPGSVWRTRAAKHDLTWRRVAQTRPRSSVAPVPVLPAHVHLHVLFVFCFGVCGLVCDPFVVGCRHPRQAG